MGIFSDAVDPHRAKGWNLVPITKLRQKSPVVPGYTGKSGVMADDATYERWKDEYPDNNFGIRLDHGWVGIDVDDYNGKNGQANLEQFAVDHSLPALPPTYSTSSRTGYSGIYMFRYAPLLMKGRAFLTELGGGVEVIQFNHRYAVAPPSIHPDTHMPYGWRGFDRSPLAEIPHANDVVSLPLSCLMAISVKRDGPAGSTMTASTLPSKVDCEKWLADQRGDGMPWEGLIHTIVERLMAQALEGTRYAAMRRATAIVVGDIVAGKMPGIVVYELEAECRSLYEMPPGHKVAKTFAGTKQRDFWNLVAGAMLRYEDGGEWRERIEDDIESSRITEYFADHPPRLTDHGPEGGRDSGGPELRVPDSASAEVDMSSDRGVSGRDGLDRVGPTADDAAGDSWRPRDLRPALEGVRERLRPTILKRTDGVGLLYPGRVNGIHADSGVGKGWLVLHAGAQHVADGGHLAWCDFEDPNEELLIDRLRLLGVGDEVIINQVHYVNPDEPADAAVVQRLVEDLDPFGPCLVVVDSTGEALGLQGADENKDLDVDGWARLLPKALERVGHTVCLVDHSTKANDNPLHPSGSKRKRALVSGASWFVELVTPFSEGHPGALRLKCAKDRHGSFRRGQVGALAHLDGTDEVMSITLEPHGSSASAATTPPKKVIDLVVLVVSIVKEAGEDGLSLSKLRAEVRLKEPASNQAIGDASEHADSLRCITITRGGAGSPTVHQWVRDLLPGDLERLSE